MKIRCVHGLNVMYMSIWQPEVIVMPLTGKGLVLCFMQMPIHISLEPTVGTSNPTKAYM